MLTLSLIASFLAGFVSSYMFGGSGLLLAIVSGFVFGQTVIIISEIHKRKAGFSSLKKMWRFAFYGLITGFLVAYFADLYYIWPMIESAVLIPIGFFISRRMVQHFSNMNEKSSFFEV